MRDDIRICLDERKYNEAELKCKQLLSLYPDNIELWYLLFLSENGNYIDIDYKNINNILAFNKVIDNSNDKNKSIINAEFNLYKELSLIKDFTIIFRNIQLGNYNILCNNILANKNIKYKANGIDVDNLVNSLEIIMDSINDVKRFNLFLLSINYLYLKINKAELLSLYNKMLLIGKSKFNYIINNDIELKIDNLIIMICNYHNYCNDDNKIDLDIDIFNKIINYMNNEEYLIAKALLENLSVKYKENIFVKLYLFLVSINCKNIFEIINYENDFSNYETYISLANISNSNYTYLTNYIDHVLKNGIISRNKYHQAKSYYAMMIYKEALDIFMEIEDYKDSSKYIKKCSNQLKSTMKVSKNSAISKALRRISFYDTKEKVKNFVVKLFIIGIPLLIFLIFLLYVLDDIILACAI